MLDLTHMNIHLKYDSQNRYQNEDDRLKESNKNSQNEFQNEDDRLKESYQNSQNKYQNENDILVINYDNEITKMITISITLKHLPQ